MCVCVRGSGCQALLSPKVVVLTWAESPAWEIDSTFHSAVLLSAPHSSLACSIIFQRGESEEGRGREMDSKEREGKERQARGRLDRRREGEDRGGGGDEGGGRARRGGRDERQKWEGARAGEEGGG